MSTRTVFRVHPTINFARFGTSQDFYYSPETSAGLPLDGTDTTGGLPLQAAADGTESFVRSGDLRDADGNLKRQAARFRLYAYDLAGPDAYPNGGGVEILPGTTLPDGRTVAQVVWTVHLANKKANNYCVVSSEGLNAFADGQVPQLRNPQVYGMPDSETRLKSLVIDPGPRALVAGGTPSAVVNFDVTTPASYSDGKGGIAENADYPKSFPSGLLYEPMGAIDTLGELRTDAQGRLLVLSAFGRTAGKYDEYSQVVQMTGDTNNPSWFDDAADGPVSATLVFTDGTVAEAFGGWVVCCDPSYAPQIRNVVSVWDDVFDAWVRTLDLMPSLYANGVYNGDYAPNFETDIHPVFRAAALQRWTVNLPPIAQRAHAAVDAIAAADDPDQTIMAGLTFIRNPNLAGETSVGVPLMPLSLGDAGKAFLTVTPTQYFFLEQWSKHRFNTAAAPALGPGELLDQASLSNCLGGRYVPGIEVSYTIRQKDIYQQDWASTGAGPFRIKHKPLDYSQAVAAHPFLKGGWIPLRHQDDGLEPGDLCKFMAIPWQTDYNSCSIHQTSINGTNTATGSPTTLYWSWPAQRPDAVYVADEVVAKVLPSQKWSIRGQGSFALNPRTASTFQDPLEAVQQWDQIGIVLQGTVIDGNDVSPDHYLEVASQLQDAGDPDEPVLAWPFNANPAKAVLDGPLGGTAGGARRAPAGRRRRGR